MEKVSQMPLRRNFMNVRQLTIAGLLSAITVFLGATGYGFVPLLVVDATILHIPTIIAAITGGRRVGMTVGFMFGVFSFVQSLRAPSALMLFAVQTSIIYDAFVCIIPRILLGLAAYELYLFLKKRGCSLWIRSMGTAVGATILHTFLFLGAYTLLIGNTYAAAKGIPFGNVINIMVAVTITNGLPEAVVSGLLITPVITALRRAGIMHS